MSAGSATSAGSAALEVRDLRVAFVQYERGLRRRVVEAVRGMTLHAHAGELVALVGASGAGKSLFGHAVLGMLPPNARAGGEVRLRGRLLDDDARRGLAGRELVLLPQGGSYLDPTARVGAQVRRAAALAGRRDPAAAAAQALAERGLEPAVERLYPHQLSGGMARRVVGAIAGIGDPAVVIADEPTPGLHPEAVASALRGLRRTADGGAAVVLITHDLRGVLGVADRVVVCREGRTVDEARVADFTVDGAGLAHPYTRALWRALPGHGFRAPADPGAVS